MLPSMFSSSLSSESSITISSVTLTLHVSFTFPSFVETVIVAVPVETAFTIPLSTVATFSLALVQTKVLSSPFAGVIVILKL